MDSSALAGQVEHELPLTLRGARMERLAAPGRGARDARAVPDRSPDCSLRGGSAQLRFRAHRRFCRRAPSGPIDPARALHGRAHRDARRAGPGGAPARPARELHARRSQRPHGSDAVRGGLSAPPRAHRQGCTGAGRGALRFDEFSDAWRLAAKQMHPLEAVRERLARTMLLALARQRPGRRWSSGSRRCCARARRAVRCAAALSRCSWPAARSRCGEDWKVRATPDADRAARGAAGRGRGAAAATRVEHGRLPRRSD